MSAPISPDRSGGEWNDVSKRGHRAKTGGRMTKPDAGADDTPDRESLFTSNVSEEEIAERTARVAEAMKPLTEGLPDLRSTFAAAIPRIPDQGLNFHAPEVLRASLPPIIDPSGIEYEFDDSPQRTAESTQKVATSMAELIALTNASLQLAQNQRIAMAKTERFTKRMTWASLAVAVASLGAAITAITVAVP